LVLLLLALGPEGVDALRKVIQAVPNGIPVILDVKRGDISSTAEAYASSAYDMYGADSVTLSPYLGWDSIAPFVGARRRDKGAFVLCKTSNPSSGDVQDAILEHTAQPLYTSVAELVDTWNTRIGTESLGLVAGATHVAHLRAVRCANPTTWILCPGVGAQGGSVQAVCEAALRCSDASGLLISSSRGICQASDMRGAAQALRDEINACRDRLVAETYIDDAKEGCIGIKETNARAGEKKSDMEPYQSAFIEFAVAQDALQFGSFTLKSGRVSPYFFNAGRFSSGEAMTKLAKAYAEAIRASGIAFDVFFGPAYKGIPLATAISMAWYELYGESKEVAYNRKEAKNHGECGLLVGANVAHRRVLIVDDVITAGTAVREAVAMLRAQSAGTATVVGVAVSLDRQETTGAPTMNSEGQSVRLSAIQQVETDLGLRVTSIVKLRHLIGYVETAGEPDLKSEIELYRKTFGVVY